MVYTLIVERRKLKDHPEAGEHSGPLCLFMSMAFTALASRWSDTMEMITRKWDVSPDGGVSSVPLRGGRTVTDLEATHEKLSTMCDKTQR